MPGLITQARPSEVRQAEEAMVSELTRRAQSQLTGVAGQTDVHIRDILPHEDLESGGGNSWGGSTRYWEQSGLEADTEFHTYTIDPDVGAEGKVIGIFAIGSVADDANTTAIRFVDGTGSEFENIQFQEYEVYDSVEGSDLVLLRNPIIVNEGKKVEIYQYSDSGTSTAPVTDNLVFHGAVAEKAGTTLGERRADASAGPSAVHRQG